MEEKNNSSQWTVLINSEEQYGLLPSDLPPPAGWKFAGYTGTETECVAYVDEHWTDMRPRSVRRSLAPENANSYIPLRPIRQSEINILLHEMRLPNGLVIQQVNPGETALLYRDIFTERCYMRQGLSLNSGDTVFDVGANIGMAALFFHIECPGLIFHAFEPAPIPYAALTANLAMHGLVANPAQCALADRSGVRQLTYYPDSTVMSGFYADVAAEASLTRSYLTRSGFDEEDVRAMLAGRHENVAIDCPVQTLSDVIAAQGVKSIDLLKLDVEKSELDVLCGLREEDWPKVRQVVAEVHDINGALKSFITLLEAHSFDVELEQDDLLRGTEIYEVFAFRKGR